MSGAMLDMAGEMGLRAGLNADIVVDADFSKEVIDVRRALIYDIEGKQVIASQTRSPLTTYDLGRRVTVTYLRREGNTPVRYGFYGTVREIIREYQLNSSNTSAAVVIERESDPEILNVRMYFRVKPVGNRYVSMSIEGEDAHIHDISIGGARVSVRKTLKGDAGEGVRGTVRLDGEELTFEGRILRKWQPMSSHKLMGLDFLAIRFLHMDRRLENALARAVRRIERETRYREMFP